MSRRNDQVYLWDMRLYAARARAYVQGRSFDEYQENEMLRMAVERCVMTVGEAAFKVSKQFKDEHPDIPWVKIIAQRHRLVHDYGNIANDRIWEVASVHAAELIELLDQVISPPPPDLEPESD